MAERHVIVLSRPCHLEDHLQLPSIFSSSLVGARYS